jgi:F-type H+-transporting ATPase subunit a
MHISPDETVLLQWGFFKINLTIACTWGIMAFLTTTAWLVTHRARSGAPSALAQQALEVIVTTLLAQIREIGVPHPERVLPFVGTLFLFIATSNLAIVIPYYEPPTGSLSTTSALAVAVFLAVPCFGIRERGLARYLKSYFEPTFIMAPLHILGEFSRTIALAVRLFGNIMSGSLIIAILLTITPLLFPIVMTVLGLLTGLVQAYIFSVLATVFIAAGTQSHMES